ncbi:hypothetical protein, partial [Elstera litoralis]|uniref:hypothetical protein n=1 Tax=Elstera litoralis TaxID=552518 RepID=UPI0018DB3B39
MPFDIVKEVPVSEDSKKDKERVKNQLENLRNLLNNQGQDHAKDCLWLYYDIKTRISMKRLSSHANDTESKEWIKKKYCIDEVSEIEK